MDEFEAGFKSNAYVMSLPDDVPNRGGELM